MGLSLTIFGSVLMLGAPSWLPEHPTVGFVIAIIGVIISHTGLPPWKRN